ncbi:hypothetical protein [Hymenobacter defluvii]|uniref:Uncharacterized protein n=1 Tax=Hymenobacter defluvii TaxID=2054411 RepID=A0ABS3TG36_9BACT|nr:hypothetical protein [Hymenobacter defluvii]MBO3272158.1 hypothetical protein [Hymenobacter defluvii]
MDTLFILTVLIVLLTSGVAMLVYYLFTRDRLKPQVKLTLYVFYLIAAPILIYKVLLLPLTPVVMVPLWTLLLVVAWVGAVQQSITKFQGGNAALFIICFLLYYGGLGYHVYQLLEIERRGHYQVAQKAKATPKAARSKAQGR